MHLPRKLLKPELLLWSFMLTITLISLKVTTANLIENSATKASLTIAATSASASIESDLKVLRLTTTPASTIQLKIHDVADDHFGSKEKLLKTSKQIPAKVEASTYTSTISSQSTLAYSQAPATLTNQANAVVVKEKAAVNEEQQEKSIEDDEATLVMTTAKQYKNNDELEREMEATDLKQVTESVMEQQPHGHEQPDLLTTDASWRKETDMKQQSRGNAINTKNDIKTTAAITKPTQLSSYTAAMTIMPHDTTTSTTLTNTHDSQAYDAVVTTFPAEQNKPDQVKLKKIQGDELTSQTLTFEKDKQARENFKPIIKDANEKLLKERTIFSSKPFIANEEWKQNLMPNELEYDNNKPLVSKMYEHNINWSPYLHPATPISDFTGKLLQEQDGVITEIEQKFRLDEFANVNEVKTTQNPKQTKSLELTQTTTFSKDTNPAVSYTVNHKILDINKNPILNRTPAAGFIERRVKKSFDFPMHRMASDAQHLQQHFDFANTKFNSNSNEQHKTEDATAKNDGQQIENIQQPLRPQPEFSTTKFYNSKELYNEMMQHKMKMQPQPTYTTNLHEKDIEEFNNKEPSLTLNSFAVLHSPKVAKLEEIHDMKEPHQQQQQKSLAIKKVTVKATKHKEATLLPKDNSAANTSSDSISDSATIAHMTLAAPKDLSSNTEMPLAALVKTKKFQKELKRAKLLIKSMMPFSNTTTAATNISENSDNNNELKALQQESVSTVLPLQTHTQLETAASMQTAVSTTTTTTTTSASRPSQLPSTPSAASSSASSSLTAAPFLQAISATSTNPPKSSLHPIVRPRILSRLQEKINSLECELQNLPQDSHLWRGNETHELLLPIMICKPNWTATSWFATNRWVLPNSRNCFAASDTPENCKSDKDCTAMMVSWEGEAEIQSGDILIVEINDALLTPKEINFTISAHNTQVYQVTRSGHEHCDVTEGILLDITPLIVDGRKLVTLYDKDLTEGVNLLIVVSELWGAQCVRLKVTTKTENCGESADCSGKGICFSNYDMEEYECQCCSGFAGPHCEEIDACTPSPCTNNGICVDLSQGHEGNSYQCLCPYGYTGKNCQYELDPCNPAECMNGGSCVGNSTHFRCDCTPGYTGPLCQHSLNECESSPCIHGICVDQEDGFRCFCQPGFAGELCNFEYNECESNPCQNGGECIDHIGSYECRCSKGYTGNRCHIKVDFCANKPCPEGRRCIDHGNEYSCECLGGRNGPDCNEMQRTQCNVNPCTHGGTCWSSGDSFYCACRPGYTGTMCEDEFVVETVVSSSEFMVDDTSARNFNDKSFGSSVVLKSPIELHNAYTAAIVLALVIFFVALYLTICHCKVNQTYRKFSTRTYGFLPILGFRLRTKQATSKISRHWLSGKGFGIGNVMRTGSGIGVGGGGGGATTSSSSTSALHATTATASSKKNNAGHLPTAKASSGKQQHTHVGQLNERPFQRHLAMNLENDMYYTVDFSENSQHSPLIQ